jgi:hypothetical protein
MTGLFAFFATLVAGLPLGLAVVNSLALAVPMALFGGGYTVLCAHGIAKVGVFAPAALYWMVGFPISRMVQEGSAGVYLQGSPGLSTDVWGFVLYNALLAPGLAFGFIWLHERLVPTWLMRIRDHNRAAATLLSAYSAYAASMYAHKQRRDALKQARKAAQAGSA